MTGIFLGMCCVGWKCGRNAEEKCLLLDSGRPQGNGENWAREPDGEKTTRLLTRESTRATFRPFFIKCRSSTFNPLRAAMLDGGEFEDLIDAIFNSYVARARPLACAFRYDPARMLIRMMHECRYLFIRR
jgi:hypothetical protein